LIGMRVWAISIAGLFLAACETRQNTDSGVRAFMQTVAHDISQEGPAAWDRHFAQSPAFFMAADGRVEYPNRAAATTGIQDLTHIIKKIELQWGDDLRVDPLTWDLAQVGASWHEVLVNGAGERMDENGYFTALAEYRDGRWQFRNAHWSVPVPPAAIR